MILNLKNLTKIIDGKVLLKNVDFQFNYGQKYIIGGESGCGKTTLLNIIASYIKSDEGIVECKNNPKIGYLFQDEMLFSNLTVNENMFIRFSLLDKNDNEFEELAKKMLKQFNILELFNRKISMLSGGEKQRVQLAMISMSEPDIVLMDEPTSKLDNSNKQSIANTIEQIFSKKLLIIVSHESIQLYNNCVNLKLEAGRLLY